MSNLQKGILFVFISLILLAGALSSAHCESTETAFAYGGATDVLIPIVIPDRSLPDLQVHEISFTFALNGPPASLAFQLEIPSGVNQEGTHPLTAGTGQWSWSAMAADTVSITVSDNGDQSYGVSMHRNPTSGTRGPLGAGTWQLRVVITGLPALVVYTTQGGSLASRDTGLGSLPAGAVSFISDDPLVPDPYPNSIIGAPVAGADALITVPVFRPSSSLAPVRFTARSAPGTPSRSGAARRPWTRRSGSPS